MKSTHHTYTVKTRRATILLAAFLVFLSVQQFACTAHSSAGVKVSQSRLDSTSLEGFDTKDFLSKFDAQILDIWKNVTLSDLAKKYHTSVPVFLVASKKSPLSRYILSRIESSAPEGIKLIAASQKKEMVRFFGRTNEFGGYLSVSTSAENHLIEIQIMFFALDQVNIDVYSQDGSPIYIKKIVVPERDLLYALVHTDMARAIKSAKLIINHIEIGDIENHSNCRDATILLTDNEYLPDIQVCMYKRDHAPICSKVLIDTNEADRLLAQRVRVGEFLRIVVKNIDTRGNVVYPFESNLNSTIAEFSFEALPLELFVSGYATLHHGCITMELQIDTDAPKKSSSKDH